jgi:tyrosyl-tRNA synthetase
MLSRDSVKSRIERGNNDQNNEEGMSYTEFSYQIL